jgi:dihydroorotate dehydrogenase
MGAAGLPHAPVMRIDPWCVALLYPVLRPLLFRLPAESAHRAGFAPLRLLEDLLERFGGGSAAGDPVLAQDLWGLHFPVPLGLAAGFDKNAELPHVWAAVGFGFAELGTVTAQPQGGNPRPRLFRLPADRALINRLGFNNRGAAAVARALAARLRRRRPPIPIGVNLGKSRSAPLDQAVDDYLQSFRALAPLADYVAVNVSSPNTPGLRDLQSAAQLEPLLAALQKENREQAHREGRAARPLLVKVAPDLGEEELSDIAAVALRAQVAGLIATNTTIERPALKSPRHLVEEAGGLSGAPLRDRATAVVRALRRSTRGRLAIVGVGGIFDAEDAYAKIRSGASLLQAYTGFVYEGPGFAPLLSRRLRELLLRDGFERVRDAVGVDVS